MSRSDLAMASDPPREARGRRLLSSTILFIALVSIYSVNGREIGAVDTIGTMMLPVAWWRGDGLTLDRYLDPGRKNGALPIYATERGAHILSRYPLLPALVTFPLTVPQVLVLDRLSPGWDLDRSRVHWWLRQMAKNSSAVLIALTGVLLHRLLLCLGLGRDALLATLATCLGTTLWVVASQSPWQHGPAALFLVVALLALATRAVPHRWQLATSGAAVGLAVCARPTMLLFAAALGLWAIAALRRRSVWFLAPAGLIVGVLVAYNLSVFDNLLLGGQAEIRAARIAAMEAKLRAEGLSLDPVRDQSLLYLRPESIHWAVEGLRGTLASPGRGLFVYSPWIPLALLALPLTLRRLREHPPVAAALCALLPFAIVVSAWRGWWAGWSFGPRFWTEVMPLFGILLAHALAETRERARGLRWALCATIALAVAIEAVGAFRYPSSFNAQPGSINQQPWRLWDWHDNELTRGLREGPPEPRDYPIFPSS